MTKLLKQIEGKSIKRAFKIIADYYYKESIVLSPENQEDLENCVVLLVAILSETNYEVARELTNNILDVHSERI